MPELGSAILMIQRCAYRQHDAAYCWNCVTEVDSYEDGVCITKTANTYLFPENKPTHCPRCRVRLADRPACP